MRETLSMDKEWKFHLGDIDINYNSGHSEVYAAVKAGNEKGPAQAIWDDSDWKYVNLPHDWVTDCLTEARLSFPK